MKRVIITLTLAGILALGAVGCGGGGSGSGSGSDSSPEQTQPAEAEQAPASAYEVTINGATVGTDYSGEPCIIVNFTFTNVSDEDAVAFSTAVHPEVYQNGVQCEVAIADLGGDGNSLTKIKAGASIDVSLAFSLQDTTSDVEVEVTELFSLEDTVLASQTFTIA